jgi:hypothetical protein
MQVPISLYAKSCKQFCEPLARYEPRGSVKGHPVLHALTSFGKVIFREVDAKHMDMVAQDVARKVESCRQQSISGL